MDSREWKQFPHCPKEIPMDILDEEWAYKLHHQTLKRLNERGGLHPQEMILNIEKRAWSYKIDTELAIDVLISYVNVYKEGMK